MESDREFLNRLAAQEGTKLPGMTFGDVLAHKAERNVEKMRKKKLFLKDLEKHDQEHEDSTVRLLEMTVDGLLPNQSYAVQFWQDVRLYGVDEATMYLKSYCSDQTDASQPEIDFDEYNKTLSEIKEAVASGKSLNEEE